MRESSSIDGVAGGVIVLLVVVVFCHSSHRQNSNTKVKQVGRLPSFSTATVATFPAPLRVLFQ